MCGQIDIKYNRAPLELQEIRTYSNMSHVT